MPQTKSAIKQLRKSREQRLRNMASKSRAKRAVTKARRAMAAGEAATEAPVQQAMRLLDKAASKGAIHRRAAARRKSRLARRLASS